jgi:hypothetical protein
MSTPGLERSVFASGNVDRAIHDRPVTRAMTICRTAGNPLVLLLQTMALPNRVRYRLVGTGVGATLGIAVLYPRFSQFGLDLRPLGTNTPRNWSQRRHLHLRLITS